MNESGRGQPLRDTKRVFFRKGTCSRTFFFLLNREFGHPLPEEEQAADLLAGGLLKQGYQCGMLWGASLALGAEAFRRCDGDRDRSVEMALRAARRMVDSFVATAGSPYCSDQTHADFTGVPGIVKYLISGRFWSCFKLAERWAPQAITAAAQGMAPVEAVPADPPLSCAAEVVRRMGGGDGEAAIVSGLAGGIGLSGDCCGALAAALWMNALVRIRAGRYKTSLSDPEAEKILQVFRQAAADEMECRVITKRSFQNLQEHGAFLRSGGCARIIHALGDGA